MRTFQANLIFPIPGGTSQIRRTSVIEIREKTLTFFKVIAFIAGSAVSVLSMSFTKVTDNNANFIFIENPTFRASETDLVVPIPGGASGI